MAVKQFSPLLMYFATLMQYTTQNVQQSHLNTHVSNTRKCRDLKRNTQDPKMEMTENGGRRRRRRRRQLTEQKWMGTQDGKG
jgi:hypothetical protein